MHANDLILSRNCVILILCRNSETPSYVKVHFRDFCHFLLCILSSSDLSFIAAPLTVNLQYALTG